jgi:hypothetical protein
VRGWHYLRIIDYPNSTCGYSYYLSAKSTVVLSPFYTRSNIEANARKIKLSKIDTNWSLSSATMALFTKFQKCGHSSIA